MQERPNDDVVVITGAGGMGSAIARRLGSGRRLVIADFSSSRLDALISALRAEGYTAQGVRTDVSERASVAKLADLAAETGPVTTIVHTAGVSAATATADAVMRVDLLGTAHVIEVFETVAGRGTALVCVASMAGHVAGLSPEEERALATVPADELLRLPVVTRVGQDPMRAYLVAKRANQVRVKHAALAWNRRGARVNTISPGVISTAMAQDEAVSSTGGQMMAMLQACGADRTGTPAEIASAVAFLTGPEALYITGTDLLVDGGQAAWLHTHHSAGALT